MFLVGPQAARLPPGSLYLYGLLTNFDTLVTIVFLQSTDTFIESGFIVSLDTLVTIGFLPFSGTISGYGFLILFDALS